MYSAVYRTLRPLWPHGLEVRRRRRELDRTQWLSRDELAAWQLAKLRDLVRHAYDHVPFYRGLYLRQGVHPEDIRTWRDFRSLPFLTREDVNSHLGSLIAPELRGITKPNSTGGSTGQPMRFAVEPSYHRWDTALELRGRGWYGVREGDKTALVWGAQRDMHTRDWRARLKGRILRERYLNAYSMTEAKMRAFAQMLVRWQPAMLRAYASALSLLARFMQEEGIEGVRPRLIELTAEKVTAPQRELLEQVFQCKVADWYTAREMGTIAFQCPEGGQHVCETRILEVVANGHAVEPGGMGEVVLTSLHQYAMPFIRYKIGDMAVLDPNGCSCGRGLPVLRDVVGRLNDYLVAANGQFVHSGYFADTFRTIPEVIRYQVYQPDRRHLEVRLVCREGIGASWLEGVRSRLQARFGEGMLICLQLVDRIELTAAGKHRYVISEVEPDFV